MSLKKFNEKTSKTQFIYRRNPVHENGFLILQVGEGSEEYIPAGEYTLLDTSEDTDLTEKKLINLVALLNGRKDLMDLANLTKTRLLYNIVPKAPEDTKTTIIFRTFDGEGVSKENAVLVLEKGVLNDDNQQT